MQHIDRNKDGFVNFQEFAAVLSTGTDDPGTDSTLSSAVRHYFLQSIDRLAEGDSKLPTLNAGADSPGVRPSTAAPGAPPKSGFAAMRQLSSAIESEGSFSRTDSDGDVASRPTGVSAFMHSSDLLTLGSVSMLATGTMSIGHDGTLQTMPFSDKARWQWFEEVRDNYVSYSPAVSQQLEVAFTESRKSVIIAVRGDCPTHEVVFATMQQVNLTSKFQRPVRRINGSGSAVEGVTPKGWSTAGVVGVHVSEGRWYYEVEVSATSGVVVAGWIDKLFAVDGAEETGICTSFEQHSHSWGVRISGAPSTDDDLVQVKQNDVIGCLADLQSKTLSFFLNGNVLVNKVVSIDSSLCPAVSLSPRMHCRIRDGSSHRPFRFPVPKGARAISAFADDRIVQIYSQLSGKNYGKLQATSGSVGLKITGLTVEPIEKFPSVRLAGVVLTKGKWYYELTVIKPGRAVQVGWADLEFSGSSANGVGVGLCSGQVYGNQRANYTIFIFASTQ